MIVHYMQPHQPFRSRSDWIGEDHNLANVVDTDQEAGPCIWQRYRRGEFDDEEFWTAYRDNLR
jgi:hypothetical protein